MKRDEEPPERAPEKAWSLKTPTRKGRAPAKKQEDNTKQVSRKAVSLRTR